MIILISGASHSGKTLLAQKLLEKYKYPYLSIDHLKMGLIRSHNTELTPLSDDEDLTNYLWPIVCEIIKTAIENKQNLIIEGCYIPFDWKEYFDESYLDDIKYLCLVLSETYIKNYFKKIVEFANVIEQRKDDSCLSIDSLLDDNLYYLENCNQFGLNTYIINDIYSLENCIDFLSC